MSEGPTIGVLSTSFGGSYFGGLMGGILGRVAAASGRLVAIQTLDAGTFNVDVADAPPFPHHVAWDHVAGFVVLLNAVDGDYLTSIRNAGLPVVVISHTPKDFSCPVVLPDNRSGVTEAVDHLVVEHGYREIGFVGYLGQLDAQERHQAYREALLKHGLSPDDNFFFDCGDMQETGGELAAHVLLEAENRPRAVITGNDENAIGMMRVLTAAGIDLPGELAVIGFDDTEEGASLIPNLTSVKQPLDVIGAKAAGLVLDLIAGVDVAHGVHHVSTSLTVRESCGCSQVLSIEPAQQNEDAETDNDTEPRLPLGAALIERFARTHVLVQADLQKCGESLTEAMQSAIDDVPGPAGPELRQALAPLIGTLNGNQDVVDVVRTVRRFGRKLLAQAGMDNDVAVSQRLENCLHQLFIMLNQVHTARQTIDAKSMMLSLTAQYKISMELLRSQERDPRSLDWLRLTQVHGGCLGVWPAQLMNEQQGELLDVVRIYDRETGSNEGTGELLLTSFPPHAVTARCDSSAGEMIYIAHLKVDSGDWGMLALVGPVQANVQQGRENMNQWAALLSVALEHEAVLKTLRGQEEHLRRAALYDELTGLPNRSLFRDRLTVAMAREGRRPGYRYAVLMLDLDGFKLVNDSLGHQAGDGLLRQVATRIRTLLRMIDTPARFGGDEFAILLEEIRDVAAATTVAERLQQTLTQPYDLDGHEVVISASIGVALGSQDYSDTESIIRDADAAMYHAKARGKRGHAVFDPSMHAMASQRLRLESELRRALEQRELELHYQPIVDLRSGMVSGAEALIRWQHPTRGMVGPGEFLLVAEESGLILPIGDWILDDACSQLDRWQIPRQTGPFMTSVNVSNRQFWVGGLIEDVAARLNTYGLDPSCLAIELTEGIIMHDVKLASSKLAELHTLGVQVHIDDFGTGYSSLEALHDLTLDALKVDRSFVSRLADSSRSRELVRTIVKMGLNLGLDVIAEGIETERELELVRELGCTHGQGYLFSRPVPAAVFEPYIGRQII